MDGTDRQDLLEVGETGATRDHQDHPVHRAPLDVKDPLVVEDLEV